jgi:hypothetical protein
MVANAFVVRGNNRAGDDNPHDGTIAHRWTASESLIEHVWKSLRDALRVVVMPPPPE